MDTWSVSRREYKTRLWIAFIYLLFSGLVSISLPPFASLDIARTTFSSSVTNGTNGIEEIRLGIWSFCLQSRTSHADPCTSFSPCNVTGKYPLCSSREFGYDVHMFAYNSAQPVHIGPTWTGSLVVHPASSVCLLLCLLLLAAQRPNFWLVYFTWALQSVLIVIDFAFFVHVRHITGKLKSIGGAADTGVGLWLNALSFFFFTLECAICLIEHKKKFILEPSRSSRRRPVRAPTQKPISMWEKNAKLYMPSLSSSKPVPDPLLKKSCGGEKTLGEFGYECPLCWDVRIDLSALPCIHVFCTVCIKRSLRTNKRCPLCSVAASTHDLRRVAIS